MTKYKGYEPSDRLAAADKAKIQVQKYLALAMELDALGDNEQASDERKKARRLQDVIDKVRAEVAAEAEIDPTS